MPSKPTIYLIAGCNGAGKTTFAKEFLPHEVKCLRFYNADEIARGLSPLDPSASAIKARSTPAWRGARSCESSDFGIQRGGIGRRGDTVVVTRNIRSLFTATAGVAVRRAQPLRHRTRVAWESGSGVRREAARSPSQLSRSREAGSSVIGKTEAKPFMRLGRSAALSPDKFRRLPRPRRPARDGERS